MKRALPAAEEIGAVVGIVGDPEDRLADGQLGDDLAGVVRVMMQLPRAECGLVVLDGLGAAAHRAARERR